MGVPGPAAWHEAHAAGAMPPPVRLTRETCCILVEILVLVGGAIPLVASTRVAARLKRGGEHSSHVNTGRYLPRPEEECHRRPVL